MTDLSPIIPASVDVVFPSSSNGATDPSHFRVNVTLASLGLSQFDPIHSVNSSAVGILPRNELALWASGSVTNSAALAALAAQVAKDWYLYQLGKLDIVFAGLTNWAPEGTSDYVEWTQTNDIVSTRVQRGSGGGGYQFSDNPRRGLTLVTGITPVIENIYYISLPTGSYQIVDGILVLNQGLGGGDIHTYRTSGGRFTSPVTTAARQDGNALPKNQIYLYPFIVPVTQTFSRLEIYLTNVGSAGAKVQLAVYDTQSATNDTPRNPLVSTADIAIDTGIAGLRGQNVTFTLSPGLYYLAANSNNSSATWRSATETLHVLGMDPTIAPYFLWIDGTNHGSQNGTAYGNWPVGGAMVTLHKDTTQETCTIFALVQ